MLRVIQWATGNVGQHAVGAVHRHPDLELAGAYVYSAEKAGRDVGQICEHITRLAPDQAPHWPAGGGWTVTVEGRPSMTLESRIATHGEDETDQGCLGTAMHAVHSIGPVCAAAPGIRTFLDLPIIAGRRVL